MAGPLRQGLWMLWVLESAWLGLFLAATGSLESVTVVVFTPRK